MSTNVLFAASVATLALLVVPATTASALTITNKDSKEQSIGLDMGTRETVHKIPAGGSVTFKEECKDACGVTGPWGYSVMLKEDESYAFDGKSLVTIAK
jgi:hypothetical protein